MLGDLEDDLEAAAIEYFTSLFRERKDLRIQEILQGLHASDIPFFQRVYIEKNQKTTDRRINIVFPGDRVFRIVVSIDQLRRFKVLNDERKAKEKAGEAYRSRVRAKRGVEGIAESLGSNVEALRQEALSPQNPSSSSSPNPASAPNPAPPTSEDNFYAGLVTAIEASKTSNYVSGQGRKKPEHFQERVSHVERKLFEYEEGWKVIAAEEQKKLLDDIRGMLLALAALSRNQAKYTETYLNQRVDEILRDVPQPHQQDVRKALIDVVEYNVLKGTKIRGGRNSVSFNAQQPAMQGAPADKRAKRLKIEHETEDVSGNKTVKVKATFGYDRIRLFGKESGARIGNPQAKYQEFKDQISDFADIAIYEYGKGMTRENPLTLSYTDSKQPEAALALLLEYKKRAVLEKRPFHVKWRGEEIMITPDENFSNSKEKAYFMSYAGAIPEIPNRNGKFRDSDKCAAYCLLKYEEPENFDPDVDKKNPPDDCLERLLDKKLAEPDRRVGRRESPSSGNETEIFRVDPPHHS